MYAIKFNDKYYFYKKPGTRIGTDIWQAELFDSKDKARSMLKSLLKYYEVLEGWEAPDDGPDNFKVVEVEIREVKDINSYSQNMYDVLTRIQKGAYARPLRESVPRSPRYTKVVNGKLVTVYHAIGNTEQVYETFEFNIEDEENTYEWVDE